MRETSFHSNPGEGRGGKQKGGGETEKKGCFTNYFSMVFDKAWSLAFNSATSFFKSSFSWRTWSGN